MTGDSLARVLQCFGPCMQLTVGSKAVQQLARKSESGPQGQAQGQTPGGTERKATMTAGLLLNTGEVCNACVHANEVAFSSAVRCSVLLLFCCAHNLLQRVVVVFSSSSVLRSVFSFCSPTVLLLICLRTKHHYVRERCTTQYRHLHSASPPVVCTTSSKSAATNHSKVLRNITYHYVIPYPCMHADPTPAHHPASTHHLRRAAPETQGRRVRRRTPRCVILLPRALFRQHEPQYDVKLADWARAS